MALLELYCGFLQVKGEYKAFSALPLIAGFTIVVSLLISSWAKNVYWLVYGTLLAGVLQLLFVSYYLRKHRYRYSLGKIGLRSPYMLRFFSMIVPVLIWDVMSQVNLIVGRTLVTTLAEGSLSTLNYANRITQLLTGLLISPICAIIYPALAAASMPEEQDRFNHELERGVNLFIILLLPVIGLAVVFAPLLIQFVYERGSFDAHDTFMTAQAFVWYAAGMLGFAVQDLALKSFYAKNSMRRPMYISMAYAVVSIIVNVLLIRRLGHYGAATTASIVFTASSLTLLFFIRRSGIAALDHKSMLSNLVKSLIAAAAASGFAGLLYRWISATWSYGLPLLLFASLTALLTLAIYVLIQLLVRNHELKPVVALAEGLFKSK